MRSADKSEGCRSKTSSEPCGPAADTMSEEANTATNCPKSVPILQRYAGRGAAARPHSEPLQSNRRSMCLKIERFAEGALFGPRSEWNESCINHPVSATSGSRSDFVRCQKGASPMKNSKSGNGVSQPKQALAPG